MQWVQTRYYLWSHLYNQLMQWNNETKHICKSGILTKQIWCSFSFKCRLKIIIMISILQGQSTGTSNTRSAQADSSHRSTLTRQLRSTMQNSETSTYGRWALKVTRGWPKSTMVTQVKSCTIVMYGQTGTTHTVS